MTWGELMQQVCAGVGLRAYELPTRAVGSALRDYCWRAAKVRVVVRLGDPRHHSYFEVRPCKRRAGFGLADLNRLRNVLGQHAVRALFDQSGTPIREHVWADPWQQSLPSPADEGDLRVPILVSPAHEELVRELVRGLVERARPGTFPEASARRQEEERARAWLTRNADRLRACAAVLGRDAVMQVLGR